MYEMSVCDDGGIRKLNSYERGLETAASFPANSANTSRGRFFIARQSYTRQESWLVSNDTTTETDTPNFTNAPPMVESEKDVAKQWTVAGTTRRTRTHRPCFTGTAFRFQSGAPWARGAEPGSRDPLARDHQRGVEGIKGGAEAVQWLRIVVVDRLELPPRRWAGGGGWAASAGPAWRWRWPMMGERRVEKPGRRPGRRWRVILVWWAPGRGERVGAPNGDYCEAQARHFPMYPLS
jgi:hypothetical protein